MRATRFEVLMNRSSALSPAPMRQICCGVRTRRASQAAALAPPTNFTVAAWRVVGIRRRTLTGDHALYDARRGGTGPDGDAMQTPGNYWCWPAGGSRKPEVQSVDAV